MRTIITGISLILFVFLTACGTPKATRYYILDPIALNNTQSRDIRPVIGVEPIELPEYLNQESIVTRNGRHLLDLAGFERWAEPLDTNISRILVENLGHLLGSDQVFVLPHANTTLDMEVHVRIRGFERLPDGHVMLVARWMLIDSHDEIKAFARVATYRQQPAGSGYDATVAAMNEALAEFSRDVAASIEQFVHS